MGICLPIRKYKSVDNKHYYHVMPQESKDFFIEIDVNQQALNFYGDEKFSKLLGTIKLMVDDRFIEIPGLDYRTLVLATGQAAKALQANSFPEFISKES